MDYIHEEYVNNCDPSDKLLNGSIMHMDSTHDNNSNSCDMSDKLSSNCTLHINTNHGGGDKICDKSDELFKSNKKGMEHAHSKQDNICNNSGKLPKHSNIHIELAHGTNCNCYKCRRNFTNIKTKEEHDIINHVEDDKSIWDRYNTEFFDILSSLQNNIATESISPDEAGTEFSNLLTTFSQQNQIL